ncbi:MAG: menaquinone biosynthesis protein [Verrucomicrobia bacterium]|nr:menaquinone biosynthesis protein [Verrucomicrobiota bacterium]
MNWRIGSVPHLNVRPLIYGIESEMTFCTPAQLADALHRREFDVGLVPVAEVLLHDQYDIIDGIGVVSFGDVRSAFLVHQVPPEQIRNISIDPASRSTVWLLRVLFAECFGTEPKFHPRGTDCEATFVFGDEAVNRLARIPDEPRLDLSAAWTEWTKLPFVYAVWAVQRGVADAALAAKLRQAKADGLAHLDEVIEKSTLGTPEIRRDYLTRRIRYDLDADAKRGLRKFQEYLVKLKLVEPHELRFVELDTAPASSLRFGSVGFVAKLAPPEQAGRPFR